MKDGEKEKSLLRPAPPDSLRPQKPSWGSLALSQRRRRRRAAGRRGGRDGKGGRVNTTRTEQRQATGFLCFLCVRGGGGRNCAVLWRQPSTSAHCCCNQGPSAAASQGETLGSLFYSWGPKSRASLSPLRTCAVQNTVCGSTAAPPLLCVHAHTHTCKHTS